MNLQEYYTNNPRPRVKSTNKLTYNIGVNDLPYVTSIVENGKKVYKCQFYSKWEGMLQRCYGSKRHVKYPSYLDVVVCDDFKVASKFKDWMLSQIYKNGDDLLQLDKDIIDPYSKIYSANTCAFVPDFVNFALYVGPKVNDRVTPVGVKTVILKSGATRYVATDVNNQHLGTYSSPEVAHFVWQESRVLRLIDVVSQYSKMECVNERVVNSLERRISMLKNSISKNKIIETLDF